jgi:transcriptional regulator with XRE-family HTH domain
MSTKTKSAPKFARQYDRSMLRSAFVSLFWSVISERKKTGHFTLQELAKLIGANKAEVSRWFKSEPNWTISTIANIANALDLELRIEALERSTGKVFAPSGLQASTMTHAVGVAARARPTHESESMPAAPGATSRVTITRAPDGSSPVSFGSIELAA